MSIAPPPETRHRASPPPAARKRRKVRARWIVIPVAALVVIVIAAIAARHWRVEDSNVVAGTFYTVVPLDMSITVAKDGDLQAVNNIDIINKVEGSNAITQIVDEGTFVHKGDILARLDSSTIKENLEDQMLNVQQAQADLTTSQEMKAIQVSQNSADIEAAQVSLQLAKLGLQQYVQGTYPQSLADAQTAEQAAEIDLKNKQEDLSQTQSLFQKGFVTPADVKTAEQNLVTSKNALAAAQTSLMVLAKYTHPMDLASKKSTLAQAEQSLNRVQRQAASNLAQKEADLLAKQQKLIIQKRRLEHDQEQLDDCTIRAPADGIVIYGTSGQRNVQNPIQEGTMVRQRQLLIRLPDTSRMKAVVMINESQVPRLKVGQRALVTIPGVEHPIPAVVTYISPVVDNSQRFWNPDLRQYPVDVTLDETPADLKPGSSADAVIFIQRISGALAVPVAAIYSSGPDNYVFTKQPDGSVRAEKVKLGSSNGTYVQILSGVQKGWQVLLLGAGQGRGLAERAGIKAPPPASQEPGAKEHHDGNQEARKPKAAA